MSLHHPEKLLTATTRQFRIVPNTETLGSQQIAFYVHSVCFTQIKSGS